MGDMGSQAVTYRIDTISGPRYSYQLVQYVFSIVLYLIASEVEPDTDCIHRIFYNRYIVQARRPEKSIFIWPAFVTRLLTPRSRNSGYGLLLGCRSGLDFGPFE